MPFVFTALFASRGPRSGPLRAALSPSPYLPLGILRAFLLRVSVAPSLLPFTRRGAHEREDLAEEDPRRVRAADAAEHVVRRLALDQRLRRDHDRAEREPDDERRAERRRDVRNRAEQQHAAADAGKPPQNEGRIRDVPREAADDLRAEQHSEA